MNQSGRKQSAGELHRRQQQQQTTPEPVSRRHSRNRLVLIGPGATGAKTAEQRDGHETGARDRRMMIDDQSGELDAGADLDDPELARKHPSKLTHGFWLRRYSGLHAAAGGAAQSRPAPGPPESDPQRAGSDATAKSARRPDRGRSRLFARWTSAVVSRGHHFGGSATGVSGADQGATGRSGATSAPPSSSAAALEMGGVKQLGRRSARHPKRTRAGETQQALLAASQSSFGCQFCGWRSGSHVASSSSFTSSSASSLSASSPVIRLADDKTKTTSGSDGPPAATSGAQRPTNGCSSEGSRSLLGDWLARSVSSSVMTTGRKQSDRSPTVEPASRLSPYRQVARLLARQRPASSSDEQQVSSGAGRSKGRKLADLLFISPRKRRKPVEGDGGRECDLSERQAESAAALGKKKPAAHEISIEGAGPAPKAGPRDESGAHLDGAPSPKSSQLPSRPSSKDGPRDVCDELSGPDKQMRQDEDKKRALVKYANERSKLEQEEEGEEEARGLCAGSLREVRPAPDLAEAEACARFASGEMGAAFSRTASKSGVLIDPARDEQSAVGGDVGSPAELPIERLISLPNAELAPQQVARAGCELTLRQPSTEAIQQSGADGTGGGRGTPAPPSCETSAAKAPHVISPSTSLLPLIQPLASSCSSFASSSIRNLDSALTAESTSQQHLDCPAGDQAEPHSQVADAEEADDASGEVEIVASVAGADQSMSRTRSRSARPRSQPVSAPQTSATTATTTTSARDESTSEKLKSNFKKLVKRQQSVDSYRMAREQKQKLRREQQERDHPGANGGPSGRQHQSSEAIRMRGGGADGIRGGRDGGSGELGKVAARDRKFSMRVTLKEAADHEVPPHKPRRQERPTELEGAPGDESAGRLMGGASFQVEICVDPYARPGSFVLPGEQIASTSGNGQSASERPAQADRSKNSKDLAKPKISPTPPNTLSLMPLGATSAAGCPSPGSLLMGSGFSGCITPTYPTHHLPSPKYVSPAAFAAMQKKHSNASTISSSLGIDLAAGPQTTCAAGQNGQAVGNEQSLLFEGLVQTTSSSAAAQQQQQQQHQHQQPQLRQHSDSGSSFSLAASNRTNKSLNLTNGDTSGQQAQGGLLKEEIEARAAAEAEAAAAAQRRANLAEHIYDNKCGLGEDMKFLASLPEMCDITFLVGETREPVCAVRSVLAARSRVFHKILFGNRIEAAARAAAAAEAAAQRTTTEIVAPDAESSVADVGDDRRGSSPRQGGALSVLHTVSNLASKSSSRSSSPNQQAQSGQQQWSVTSDASGFNQRPAVVSRTDSTVTGDAGRSGRVSVASGGRESISQASQGSHQPLIIGPGQTTAPAPLRKGKKSRREDSTAGHQSHSRLSRMFLNKRASDPSIKQPHPAAHGQAASGGAGATSTLGDGPSALAAQSYYGSGSGNQSYLDKMSSSQRSTTVIIEEFEPDVFRQLIEYIHTGCVLLQARTLLGLLNAADYYGLEQLRRACLRFVSCCITVDTVCSLLSTAERYIQYKCTKSIVQKVLEFVDTHANDIFKLNAFGLLPEHVVRLILARDGLQADEQVKYEGVYTWCEHYCRSYELTNMADVMQNFLDLIQFHKIPTSVLLTEIYPTHIVPDEIFLSALAYQADPDVFEPQPSKQRRMTLPSSLMLSRNEEHSEHGHSKFRNAFARRQSNSQALKRRRSMLGARKSTGSSGVGGDGSDMSGGPTPSPISSKASGRKGSIAQVSISNVKRLSHRLPLRKRHSNMQGESLPKPPPTPPSPHPVAQQSSSPTTLHQTSSVALEPAPRDGTTRMGKRQLSLATGAASQNSAAAAAALAVSAAAAGNQQEHSRDPIQLGRQILDAYLAAKREQELEEERQKREAEAAEIERLEKELSSVDPNDPNRAGRNTDARTKRQPLVKTPSSSRKSFRDFKYISRKLFMRHSSSKSIQVQTSVSSGGSQQPKRLNSSDSSGPRQSADFQHRQLSQETQPAKARKLLKIRRSETVYEATPVTPEADGGHAGGRLLQQLSSNLRKG